MTKIDLDLRIRHSFQDTLFGRADSTLSDIASQLALLNRAEHECYEDIDIFGAPSECKTQVKRSYDRMRAELFAEHGTTEDEALEAIKDRTTEKWIHFHSNLI